MDAIRNQLGKGIMEMVGTAILVMTIHVAVAEGGSLAGVAIGVVLMCVIYAGGPISGAHYNPAISLAIMLRGKMELPEMVKYWIFQVVGGVLGCLLGDVITDGSMVFEKGPDFSTGQALLAELVITFLLCFTVLGVATHSDAENNSYYGVAIGMVVLVGAISVGPISGGAFNPAVALGHYFGGGMNETGYVIGVLITNLLGGVIAAGVFYWVAPDQFGSSNRYGKSTMELVGTAILVMTIHVAADEGGSLAGVAIGVVLMCVVYAGGPISGAHYNPAISLAIMLRGKMELPEMVEYWIFQVVGGVLGCLLGDIITDASFVFEKGTGFSTEQALLAELVITFLLCFTVLGVATHSGADKNSYYGAAIGMVVLVGAISVGPISGGSFNPAVALGHYVGDGLKGTGYVIEVLITNLLGGAIAAGVFYMVAPDQFSSSDTKVGEATNLV